MFEVQFDWTFAKLLEVTVASIDTPEQLPDTDVVCERWIHLSSGTFEL